jgi:hypothetical protein
MPSRRAFNDNGDNSDNVSHAAPVKIILAVDIGSSSTRCTPWVLQRPQSPVEGSETANSQPSLSFGVTPLQEEHGGGCGDSVVVARSVRQVRAIHPDTGRIISVPLLLSAVDEVVDEILERMRTISSASSFAFEIVGVGFTSFVMNLVGVDESGEPVDDDRATLTYACNTPEVAGHVRALKRYVLCVATVSRTDDRRFTATQS